MSLQNSINQQNFILYDTVREHDNLSNNFQNYN